MREVRDSQRVGPARMALSIDVIERAHGTIVGDGRATRYSGSRAQIPSLNKFIPRTTRLHSFLNPISHCTARRIDLFGEFRLELWLSGANRIQVAQRFKECAWMHLCTQHPFVEDGVS